MRVSESKGVPERACVCLKERERGSEKERERERGEKEKAGTVKTVASVSVMGLV